MKKIFYSLLSLSFLGMGLSAEAQNFTVETGDTAKASVYSYVNIHNNIVNTSGSPLKIEWKVIANDFPPSWSTAARLGICDNALCRDNSNNQLLSGTTFTSFDYAANDTGDFHVQIVDFEKSEVVPGTHYITVNLQEVGTTDNKDVVFKLSKWANGVTSVTKSNEDVTLYPNPAKNVLNVTYKPEMAVKSIAVYNLVGKQVSQFKVAGTSAQLDIEQIPSGIYFLRLVNNSGQVVATRRFTHQ